MAEATVRPAIAGDGLAIAWVQLEVWQTGFVNQLPPQLLATSPADLAQSWTAAMRKASQPLLVAVEGAQIVGFVQAGLGGEAAEIGEIRVLYVRPAWARRGHGGRLIAAAAQALRALGAGSGEWWIPETDIASQRFAGSIGWAAPGGVRVLDTGRAMLTERRWTGSLDLVLAGD